MMTSSLLHLLPPTARRLLTRRSSPPGRAQPRRPRPSRTGAMLAEVLISIFVMGLGVVAVASLFPISVIRSVQATQLTSAAIFRGNAEAVIDILPQILHNPDGLAPVPPLTPPLAYHPINDPSHNGTNYVVDPAGFFRFRNDYLGYEYSLGNNGVTPAAPPAPPPGITRFNGGFTAATADGAVTMLDSWIEVVPEAVTDGFSVSGTTCTMPATADLTTISFGAGNPMSRLVFRGTTTGNEALRAGHVRNISGPISVLNVPFANALPANFTPSNVRIETQLPRYTWMLTVKKAPYPAVGATIPVSPATVDLVVFFNRAYTPDDERVYSTAATAFNQTRGNKVLIDPIAGVVLNLKKGSYIFDAVNCLWYRILSYDISVTPHEVMVDRDVQLNSNRALLMSGIVEVFPLGVKSPRGN